MVRKEITVSEVKRYWIHWNDQLYAEDKNGDLVMAADFDRVTAERDALRNEIGQVNGEYDRAVNKVDALQALLTAADERADVLEGLLRTSLLAMSRIYEAGRDFIVGAGSDCDSVELMMENDPTAREIRAALKPAEGGGDDYRKSCEVAHKALSMENQRITPVEKKTDPRVIDALREAGYLRND